MISRGAPSRPNAGGAPATPWWATGTFLQFLSLVAGAAIGALYGWISS